MDMKTFENENKEIIISYSQCNAFQTLGVILLVSFVKLNAFTVGTQLSTEYTFSSFMEIKFHKQTKTKCNEKSSEIQ